MSKTVDQRVVEMRFDNKQFEREVSTTMSSVEKLKKSLDFDGASKGLDNLSSAAKNCDVGAIGRSAETVGLKFSALYSIADQAFRNITNSAMSAGKRIISALTIDPIKTGFSEYETKMNAIQTIMSNTASKGTTMDDVTKTLNELNTYADKTIYNFAEMTRNIGTFTAAGVGLDESAKAIQGIANLAAASGSTSQQASTAMYQLSQALSAGTVRLMDWNSVVNAGMGGEKFQEALKATAREHGVAIDDIIKKNGSFRESLSDGWLSADILNETLRKFTVKGAKEYAEAMVASGKYTQEQADALIKEAQAMEDAATKVKTFTQLWDTLKESAQSGWAQTWEIIVGDFEEAKEFLTTVSDVIGGFINKTAEARNEMLENWKVMGGRTVLIDSITNIFEGLVSIIKPISQAFKEIFPPITAEQLLKFTEGLRDLTSRLKISDKTSDKLKRTFRGLFAVVRLVVSIFKAAMKAVGSLLGVTGELGGGILSITAAIGDFLFNLSGTIEQSKFFDKAFMAVADTIKFIIKVVKSFGGVIKDTFNAVRYSSFGYFLSAIRNRFVEIGEEAEVLTEKVSSSVVEIGRKFKNSTFFKVLEGLWKTVKAVAVRIGKVLGNVFTTIADKLESGDLVGLIDIINGVIGGGLGLALIKLVKTIIDVIRNIKEGLSPLGEILDNVAGCIKGFQNKLNADALKELAIAIAILAGSILVLSFIPLDRLIPATAAIGTMFAGMLGALMIMKQMTKTLGEGGGAKGIKGFMDRIKLGFDQTTKQLIAIAISVVLLASACAILAKYDWQEIAVAVGGVTILMGALLGMLVGMNKLLSRGATTKKVSKMVMTLIPIVIMVYALARVCERLAYLSWSDLAKGLTGVSVLMGAMLLALVAIRGIVKSGVSAGDMIKAGLVILAMSASIALLTPALVAFSIISWGALGKGVVGLTAVLASLIGAVGMLVLLSKNQTKILKGAAAIAIVAASVRLVIPAFMLLSALKWEAIARGFVGLNAVLLTFVGVIAILSLLGTKALVGAASIAIMAASINMLVPIFMLLTTLNWGAILRGVVALVSVLTAMATVVALMGLLGVKAVVGASAIAIMAMSLAVLTPVLLTLGHMSWESIAKGLVSIAGAFIVLAAGAALLAPISKYVIIVAGAIALIGVGSLAAGAGVIALAVGIGMLAPALVALGESATAVVKGLQVIAQGIELVITAIVVGAIRGLAAGIIAFSELIAGAGPVLIEAFVVIISSLLDAIIQLSPKIAQTIVKLVLDAVTEIRKYIQPINDAILDILVTMTEGLAERVAPLFKALTKILITGVIEGTINAFAALNTSDMKEKLASLDIVIDLLAKLSEMAILAPLAMVGIVGFGAAVIELGTVLATLGLLSEIPGLNKIIGKSDGLLSTIGDVLSDFMEDVQPFVDAICRISDNVIRGAEALVEVILSLTAANVINGIMSFGSGESSLAKFGSQLPELAENLNDFATSLGDFDDAKVKSVEAASQAIVHMANAAKTIPNEGGWIAKLVGDNSISTFGGYLPELGTNIKGFADNLGGFSQDQIAVVANAATAIKEIATVAKDIPNEGGWIAKIVGDNSISVFGSYLPDLGSDLRDFASNLNGFDQEEMSAVVNAAKAIKELSTVARDIPNEGGWISKIVGDNSIATFGGHLPGLGQNLAGFAAGLQDFNEANAAAILNAGQAMVYLSQAAANIPKEGGWISKITGEGSIATFGGYLPELGTNLAGFAANLGTFGEAEALSAASGAQAIAHMATAAATIPKEGGWLSKLLGDNSIATFGGYLPDLGSNLSSFATNLGSFTDAQVNTVSCAAKAISTMATAAASIPNEGGWFSKMFGDNSIATFGGHLPMLGTHLGQFATNLGTFTDAQVTTVSCAAKAVSLMAESTGNIKNARPDWAKTLFGDNSIATFSGSLPTIGTNLAGFATNLGTFTESQVASVTCAADAICKMAEASSKIDAQPGWAKKLFGDDSLSAFGKELASLGNDLKSFVNNLGVFGPDKVSTVNSAVQAVEAFSKLADSDLKGAKKNLEDFGEKIVAFGGNMKSYFSKVSEISAKSIENSSKVLDAVNKISSVNDGGVKSASKAIEELVKSITNMAKVPSDCTSNFKKAMKELAGMSLDTFTNPFEDSENRMKKVGQNLVKWISNGIKDSSDKVENAGNEIVRKGANEIESSSNVNKFYNAASDLVSGFCKGISDNTYKAEAKAKAMARAAADAAEEELDINSPSKVLMRTGYSIPEGLALGIDKMSKVVETSSVSMADVAIDNVGKSISRIAKLVNEDVDAQPTIRPVLDLSDVKAGAGAISSMLGSGVSLDVLTNVGSISSMMNKRNQNGVNDDIISAIAKLGKDLAGANGDTYNINGVTYDDGSNIADAVKDIVRAAKIARRT